MLQDIAILTGGQVISDDLGMKLENVGIDMLGRAKKIRFRTAKGTRTERVEGTGRFMRLPSRPRRTRARARRCGT